jgi:hypothetical protein
MTEFEIIEKLKKHMGATEVYHVTKFKAYRTAKDGAQQEVEVEVWDRGPSSPETRYSVSATADDGKTASGNNGSDLNTVLATVHWYNLDKP